MTRFFSVARIHVAVRIVALTAALIVSPITVWADQSFGSADHVHVVRVVRDNAAGVLSVSLRIDTGYHVNANPASSPYLIPTKLEFANVVPVSVTYPPGFLFKAKFADEAISVYQGAITIAAHFPSGTLKTIDIIHGIVVVQACTVDICLPPSDLPVVATP